MTIFVGRMLLVVPMKLGSRVVSPTGPCRHCGRVIRWFQTRAGKLMPFEDMEFRGDEIFPGCYAISRRDGSVIPIEEIRSRPESAITRHYCSEFAEARRTKRLHVAPAAELLNDALSGSLF